MGHLHSDKRFRIQRASRVRRRAASPSRVKPRREAGRGGQREGREPVAALPAPPRPAACATARRSLGAPLPPA